MEFTTRPYQQECIDIIDNRPTGKMLVVMATGLGKTATFTHLKREGRTLILSHRDELVRQPQKFYPDCTFGVEKADEKAENEDVVSASIQTISQDERLKRYKPDDFNMIIIDEAHHAAAKSYRKVLDYFSGAKKIIGVTATPARGDKVGLDQVFDEIVFNRDLKWGIQNGYLSRLRAARVEANFSLKNVKKTCGDFSQSDLDNAMNDGVFMTAAKTYATDCYPQGKHVLVYCTTKEKVRLAVDLFRSVIPADEADTIQMILGETPQDERDKILEDFKAGKVKVIINCMVLTEGTDLPICNAIINLRPTANQSLYQQIVGRGTRLYDGKEYTTVYDIIPSDKDNRKGICTAPSLFGLDPDRLDCKQSEKITPDVDLMDLCDDLTGVCIDLTKAMQIHVELTEAFIDEVESLTYQCDNLKNLAKLYEQLNDEKLPDDLDFGGLNISVGPQEKQKYIVSPTYKSKITFSEPNVLGDTTVTIFLKDEYFSSLFKQAGIEQTGCYKAVMKFPKAVSFVKSICKSLPDYFQTFWNKKARYMYQDRAMTAKQKYRIEQEYNQEIPEHGLSMYEASTLIDMNTRIKEAYIDAQKYNIKPGQKSATKEKIKSEFERNYVPQEEQTLDKKEIAALLQASKAQKTPSEILEDLLKRDIDWQREGIAMSVFISKKFLRTGIASQKQLEYAKTLEIYAATRGIFVDEHINYAGEESYVVSAIIDIFQYLNKTRFSKSSDRMILLNTKSIRIVGKKAYAAKNSSKDYFPGTIIYCEINDAS